MEEVFRARGVELALAALLMAATFLLPWWQVDCDDGCSDGTTGVVSAHMPGEWRLYLILGLLTLAAGTGFCALGDREGWWRRLSWWAPVAGVLATIVMVTLLIAPPAYENGAPILVLSFGWWAAMAAVIALGTACIRFGTAVNRDTKRARDRV